MYELNGTYFGNVISVFTHITHMIRTILTLAKLISA